MTDRRRTFAPVVLVGLAAAALAAVAGARPWIELVEGRRGSGWSATLAASGFTTAGESPLAAALALVVLACWGVVLVTRRRFRRGVALVGAIAGLGLTAAVVSAPWTMRDDLVADVRRLTGGPAATQLTVWWWVALVAAVLVAATTVLGAVLVRHWPEMGARYDAPTGAAPVDRRTPETGLDMWKALDEGRDPTA